MIRFLQRVLRCLEVPYPRHIEPVFPQETAEFSFILQNDNRFIRPHIGKPHLFRYIGGSHNAGITGKGHDAVHLELAGKR